MIDVISSVIIPNFYFLSPINFVGICNGPNNSNLNFESHTPDDQRFSYDG